MAWLHSAWRFIDGLAGWVLKDTVPSLKAASVSLPKAVCRVLVLATVAGFIFGLVGWSYTSSSALSSGLLTKRVYGAVEADVASWTSSNYSYTCECPKWGVLTHNH